MSDEPSIFLSYRRSDAGGHARALHDYLSGRFGAERIFFDRSTIENGDPFPERLHQGVEGCAVLLALIGPDWLDTKDAAGARRLDDPSDFVRQEIGLALDRGKTVIPVLFDDTPVPPAHRLPDTLKDLAKHDALTLGGEGFFRHRGVSKRVSEHQSSGPLRNKDFLWAGLAIAKEFLCDKDSTDDVSQKRSFLKHLADAVS